MTVTPDIPDCIFGEWITSILRVVYLTKKDDRGAWTGKQI